MASSQKFSSGLNNWAGTDKPKRVDFVEDNRILDENALWKGDYDADGGVKAAGGIGGYALAKSQYDPQGAVSGAGGIASYALDRASYDAGGGIAQAGGIGAAINSALLQNGGFGVYQHAKTGTVHSLSSSGGGGNIRFVAVGPYLSGDTFVVDGTACSAQTPDGQPLIDNCFVQNAVVTCFREGNVLNFNMGGGVGVNYDVVGGTTRPLARTNRFWVLTDTPIGAYHLVESLTDATPAVLGAVSSGDVVIVTKGAHYPFGALKGPRNIALRPAAAYQWSGSAWQERNFEFYYNNAWVAMDANLYNNGALVQWVVRGNPSSGYDAGTVLYVSSFVSTSGQGVAGILCTAQKIDVSSYNYLKVYATDFSTNVNFWPSFALADTHFTNAYLLPPLYARGSIGRIGEHSVNISHLTGSYYVVIFDAVGGDANLMSSAHINRVWLSLT